MIRSADQQKLAKRPVAPASGSVGLMLIVVSLVVFLLLPFLLGLIQSAYSQLMVLRAGDWLDETLPSASLCLDLDQLAEGTLSLDNQAVDALLRSRLAATLPSILESRLEIVAIQVSWQQAQVFENHFLGSDQPSQTPVVTGTVRVLPLAGAPVLVSRSVQLLQNPH